MTIPANKLSCVERFVDYDKSLACIHCGLCLPSCPTYLETGNENDSPRGRIYLMRAVQDGRLPLGDTAVRHIDLCLGCRACEAACPSGVQYGELLEHTRHHIQKHFRRSLLQNFLRRVVIEKVFPFPGRLKSALVPATVLRALRAQWLPPKFAREVLSLVPEHTRQVSLPEFSPARPPTPNPSPKETGQSTPTGDGSPLIQSPGQLATDLGAPRGRVGFVSGCVMTVLFGETNANSVRLLNRAGYDVVVPPAQGCCGALYAHAGNLERARDCARRSIELFERHDLEAVIINAAGCGSTLKEYGRLLHDDPAWADRGAGFSAKVKDLTEFLVSSFDIQAIDQTGAQSCVPVSGLRVGADSAFRTPRSALKVTYHDACHLAHPQRITKQPRDLVKMVAGKNFVELPESDVCCGSAGSYNLTEPEMAGRLQRRKVDCILKTGAQVVVTTNPGCILQIRAGLKKAHADIEVLHIADFLMLPISPPDGPATT